MKVAVIGAGPAGLTAAYVLAKSVPTVEVFEASDNVGGLARSLKLWGQTVDLGPHRFFSSNRRVNELWLEVVGRDYAMVNRLTRILYKGKFFQYPLQPFDALAKLGPWEAARCAASYAAEKLRTGKGSVPFFAEPKKGTDPGTSFESWVTSRFGRRLFDVFFKSYSEKLWGIPCDELDSDFAAQRIKKFSLGAAIRAAVWKNGGAAHRTLADQFAYPLEGTGMVYSRMRQAIENRGGKVHLNTPIQRVVADGRRSRGVQLANGSVREFDQVISSMPLTVLVSRLMDAPAEVREAAGQLTFRNTILVYLRIASPNVCPDNWLYVQEPQLRAGRITNFRNWVPSLYGDSPDTILAVEFWCNDSDPIWRDSEEALVALARGEVVASGLLADRSLILDGAVCRIPRCYPVYRRGYRRLLEPIEGYLRTIDGLQVIGRYGAFKYNNQDHSILMGLLAAENVLADARHDLFSVNCDYETYQESGMIAASGLRDFR
jgi:protoporphyrinogen oxidase